MLIKVAVVIQSHGQIVDNLQKRPVTKNRYKPYVSWLLDQGSNLGPID